MDAKSDTRCVQRIGMLLLMIAASHCFPARGGEPDDLSAEARYVVLRSRQLDLDADFAESTGDVARALRLRKELADRYSRHLPKGHWRVVDARRDVEHLKRLSALSPEQKKEVKKIEDLLASANDMRDLERARRSAEAAKKACKLALRVWGEQDDVYMRSLLLLARAQWEISFFEEGDYHLAVRTGRRLCDLQRKILGDQHPDYIQALGELATAYAAAGKPDEAINAFEEAIAVARRHSTRSTAWLRLRLGRVYWGRNQWKKAASQGRQAQEFLESTNDKDSRRYARSLCLQGKSLTMLGNLDVAAEILKEAVGLLRNMPDERNGITLGRALIARAKTLRQVGHFKEAERLGEEALQLFERHLGREHEQYFVALFDLATTRIALGKWNVAQRNLEAVHTGLAKRYGEEHVKTFAVLYSLAQVLDGKKQTERATSLYRELLIKADSLLKQEPYQHFVVLSVAGDHFLLVKDYESATQYYLRAREILAASSLSEHPDSYAVGQGLAEVYFAQHKSDLAQKELRSAIALVEKHYGPNSIRLVQLLDLQREILDREGKTEAAQRVEQRIQKIEERKGEMIK